MDQPMSGIARSEQNEQCSELHATPEQWRAAYEAKIQDLARETLRTSTLSAVVRRMYEAMAGWGKDAGYHPHQIRRFFTHGFPPDEQAALLAALPDAERDWVLSDD